MLKLQKKLNYVMGEINHLFIPKQENFSNQIGLENNTFPLFHPNSAIPF